MAISTLVLALTGGGGSVPVPAPKPPDKSGLKEWVKKTPTGPWARPGLFSWQGRCGPARYHWLNCLLALEYIGKDCDLARRKFVGLGHCCGDPASRGCSGLASEMITKAPQGHPLSQRPQGPFFLLRRPSRSAVPPLTCRRCQLRCLSKAVVPC